MPRVEIYLDTSNAPVVYDAEAVYTKGGLLCIKVGKKYVKYPLCRVHKVVE